MIVTNTPPQATSAQGLSTAQKGKNWPYNITPWRSLLLFMGLYVVVSFIGGFVIGLTLALGWKLDPVAIQRMLKTNLLLIISTNFISMMGTLFLYLWLVGNASVRYFYKPQRAYVSPMAITFLLSTASIVLNFALLSWNLSLPISFGKSARQFYDFQNSAPVRAYIRNVSDWRLWGKSFVAICILSPIYEEFIFRGFLQTIVKRMTYNKHVPVWAAAFVFGIIHWQPFAFFNRVMLGVLLGYLYLWSENLLFSIAAHFLNNFIVLCLNFLYIKEHITYNIAYPSMPSIGLLTSALVTVGVLMYYFKKLVERPRVSIQK